MELFSRLSFATTVSFYERKIEDGPPGREWKPIQATASSSASEAQGSQTSQNELRSHSERLNLLNPSRTNPSTLPHSIAERLREAEAGGVVPFSFSFSFLYSS